MNPKSFASRRLVCFALAGTIVLPLVARGDERAADAIAAPQGARRRSASIFSKTAAMRSTPPLPRALRLL